VEQDVRVPVQRGRVPLRVAARHPDAPGEAELGDERVERRRDPARDDQLCAVVRLRDLR
jgi:hypothetical protein